MHGTTDFQSRNRDLCDDEFAGPCAQVVSIPVIVPRPMSPNDSPPRLRRWFMPERPMEFAGPFAQGVLDPVMVPCPMLEPMLEPRPSVYLSLQTMSDRRVPQTRTAEGWARRKEVITKQIRNQVQSTMHKMEMWSRKERGCSSLRPERSWPNAMDPHRS